MQYSCRATQTISTCSGNSTHSKKSAFRARNTDFAGKIFPYPAGIKRQIALISLPHPPDMAMIVTFQHKRCRRHLRGRYIKAADGVFHMQQFIVIAPRCDPTHAQARCNAFTERAAQQHSPVDIPGMNGPRARILRRQFAVDIIFKKSQYHDAERERERPVCVRPA